MNIDIVKENEDGTVVIKKEQLTTAQAEFATLATKATDNFTAGFAKGSEKTKGETLKELTGKLSFLNLDANDLDGSISKAQSRIKDLEKGKIGESDEIKTLQTQLTEKQTAYDDLNSSFAQFKTSTLIDGTIKSLAIENNAVNVNQVPLIFKNEFSIDLDDKNNVIVKNKETGQPMFDGKGDPLTVKGLFEEKFKKDNPHLFKATGSGGGGGGGDKTDFSHVKTLKDFKTDEEKVQFQMENGMEAYNKLVVASTQN